MSKHEKFILTPISTILKESSLSCISVNKGISSYPLCEYIMQTTFLKMTGANEQKIKCILWELATDDYEFRYEYLNDNYGECSRIEHKEKAFQNLIKCIKKITPDFEISEIEKSEILTNSKNECENIFDNSIFSFWYQRAFNNYKNIINGITSNQFCIITDDSIKLIKNKKNLSAREKLNNLQDIFSLMYRHRNRCAHNLLSYQDNLPSLKVLNSEEYKYDNWFLRFFILVLIDNTFTFAFKKYLEHK